MLTDFNVVVSHSAAMNLGRQQFHVMPDCALVASRLERHDVVVSGLPGKTNADSAAAA